MTFVARTLLLGGILCATVLAQCSDGSTQHHAVHHLTRVGSNSVDALAGTETVGDYWETWDAYVDSTETIDGTQIHSGSDYGSFGDIAGVDWNDAPSSVGAGNFSTSNYHQATSQCGDLTSYTSGDSLSVSKPTISGFFSGNAFWNLGPGTNDPQQTWYGGYYYQSVALTFNSNCNAGDTCTDTPEWTLSTTGNQAILTTTSGTNTTITKGSAQGTCNYDSTLSVSIGGFSSDSYAVAVNSPYNLSNTSESTGSYMGGYSTSWNYELLDACDTPNALLPIPVSESFPSAFSQENGASGWNPPTAAHWEPISCGADSTCAIWTDFYEFTDGIAAYGSMSPTPTYTVNSSPYSYNTVLYEGEHDFYTGGPGVGGFLVYAGTIQ